MGICRSREGGYHRIDIKYYPAEQYPFAVLYFTGSANFNRAMRIQATRKGLQLGDHGAVPRTGGKGGHWKGAVPVCITEEDIFELVGMEYRRPEERDL